MKARFEVFDRATLTLAGMCLTRFGKGLRSAILPLFVLVVPVISANAFAQAVKLTEQIRTLVPAPWRVLPTQTKNMVRLALPATRKSEDRFAIKVTVSTEVRPNHENAIKRLQEIDAELDGKIEFFDLNGWPALDRIAEIELPSVEGDFEKQWMPPVRATAVTVAICVGETVVRFEGTLQPGVRNAKSEDVLHLARGLDTGSKPTRLQTEQDLEVLKKRALIPKRHAGNGRPEPRPPIAPNVLPSPAIHEDSLRRPFSALSNPPRVGVAGVGELQIAASKDGKSILIATNAGSSLSTDFGVTYTPLPGIPWGFPVDGDPSVGVGASGDFYAATLGTPTMPTAVCTASVAQSVDGGKSFSFIGHAATCPATGAGACIPDQEQMAVDRFRTAGGGGDQLYVVWRGFGNDGDGTCRGALDYPVPTISCSEDGGKTWGHQQIVGTGDQGRVTVGPDGFVYVTYVYGSFYNIFGYSLLVNKFSSCSLGLKQQPGFPLNISRFTGVECPVPGLDRCDDNATASPQPAVDENDATHVFVAHADKTVSGNENVLLRESLDGGLTWPVSVIMNSPGTARRFLPWVCNTQGITYVSWYDRSSANMGSPDSTQYFTNSATQNGTALAVGAERNLSGKTSDLQCASGWPVSLDNQNDANGCPAGTSPMTGVCFDGSGKKVIPRTPCNPNPDSCAPGNACKPGGGEPKYGDYNGNACVRAGVFVAWASATPPEGVTAPPPGINVYADRLNFPMCGSEGQACCFEGRTACTGPTAMTCDATNTCVKCGGTNQACCSGPILAFRCGTGLVCSAGQCTCGGPGEPCCGASQTCQAGFTCNPNRTCSCGGQGELCCNQTQGGGTCNGSTLVCDPRSYQCITSCGHAGQPCCSGTTCNFGFTCSGNVCQCGGLNQSCCAPGATCSSSLVCSGQFCVKPTSSCGQCTTQLQSCKANCRGDAACQCRCQNENCSCLQAGACGLSCPIQTCSAPQ